MTDSLREAFRVLKPDGWLSLVFSNSSGEMWALVQRAVALQSDEGIRYLLAAAEKGAGSPWAVAALGDLPEAAVRDIAGRALTSDLERALVPAWTSNRSWLRSQELDTPLRFLQRQTIRHLA